RLPGLCVAARPAEDLPEREQQLAGAVRVAGPRRLEHLQPAGVAPRRLLVAVLRCRPVPGAPGVVDRLVGHGRPGLAVVAGELAQVRFEVAGVDRLERLADRAVQARAPR